MSPSEPTQLEFDAFNPRSKQVRPGEVEWLVNYLRHRGWRAAAEILADAGRIANESAKRKIRLIAAASDGRVASAPGMPGYKLTEELTAEEFGHIIRSLRSQEDEMKRRRMALERVFYSGTKCR